jgi:predicted short-subunit dehydrogenase-like oxidoreductase (DUF2520 family)
MGASEIRRVIVIGAGNVALNFAVRMYETGVRIMQICSRNKEHARYLAGKVSAECTSELSELNQEADLYLIAVSDDAIEEVAGMIPAVKGIVVHTAGSVEVRVLKKVSENYGVIYPLQSLSNEEMRGFYDNVPLCIEANDAETLEMISGLAKKMSKRVIVADTEKRRTIHLAAVFVNNFTNYMYLSGEKILEGMGIEFDLFKPLIMQTTERILEEGGRLQMTGPAARRDVNTINKHIDMLRDLPELREVYELITGNIMKSD